MIDREVDFNRLRRVQCTNCKHIFTVDWNWLEESYEHKKTCKRCGIDFLYQENSVIPCINNSEKALDDNSLVNMFWYHTTDIKDWPNNSYNPLDSLTEDTIKRMGGLRRAQKWNNRMKNKALHLGTYEASVFNMYRRIEHEDLCEKKFYLYRVKLRKDSKIYPGWKYEPASMVGEFDRDEMCPKPYNVARYLNYYEDPGTLSLAIRPEAIDSTQVIGFDDTVVNKSEIENIVYKLKYISEQKIIESTFNSINLPQSSLYANNTFDEIFNDLPIAFSNSLRHTVQPVKNYESFANWLIVVKAFVTDYYSIKQILDSKPLNKV